MKIVLVGLMIALLTVPALAQRARGGHRSKPDQQQQETAQKKKALDADYKSALSRIPDANKKTDPWQKVR